MNLKHLTESPGVFTDAVIIPSMELIDPELRDTLEFPSGMVNMITMLDGENMRVVSPCSEDYYLAKNSDIHEVITTMLNDMGIKFNFGAKLAGIAEFEMTYVLDMGHDDSKKLKVGELYPTIRVINSYNRRIKLGIKSGIFRLFCENGCANLHSSGTELNSLHTSQLRQYIKESIESITGELVESFRNMIGDYSKMVDIKVENPREVIEQSMEALGIRKNRMELFEERLAIETVEFSRLGMNPNMFMVYNILNYGLNHSGTFDIKQFTSMDTQYIRHCLNRENAIINR